MWGACSAITKICTSLHQLGIFLQKDIVKKSHSLQYGPWDWQCFQEANDGYVSLQLVLVTDANATSFRELICPWLFGSFAPDRTKLTKFSLTKPAFPNLILTGWDSTPRLQLMVSRLVASEGARNE